MAVSALAARKVLVLRALGLGDLLTAVPALRALRRRFATQHLILATPAPLAALALHTGAVDEVLSTPALGPLACDADVAVNLHGRGPQSHRALLETRPLRLIAFAHDAIASSRGGPRWREDEHEVQRWCRLLDACGVPADPSDLDLATPPGAVPAHVRGASIVHPGAKDAARRWPLERWTAVARAERAAGRDVIVTGDAAERLLAEAIVHDAGLPRDRNLAGRLDLMGLAAHVAAAGRVLCGDTGIAHLATAVRTPSVVLFGPMPPACWGPPRDREWHRALWKGERGDAHGTRPDPGLLKITVAEVLAASATLPRAPVAAETRVPA